MASLKVCDPVQVPASVLAELADIRVALGLLRQDNERLRQENERLQRELAESRRLLEGSRRQAKRQAAPFSKGPPTAGGKRPGRKPGTAHGRHGHRPATRPGDVDETHEAALPDACPGCGGQVERTGVAPQYQAEIPRRPITRRFSVHFGRCRGCGKCLRGRHPLQTSDALGAAAPQLGPDAQAALVLLNKDAGLSHGKAAAVLAKLFGISVTRGASAQVGLRAAGRLGAAHREILAEVKASRLLAPDETGWRVGGRAAWLHAWAGERATCYAIDPLQGGGRPGAGPRHRLGRGAGPRRLVGLRPLQVGDPPAVPGPRPEAGAKAQGVLMSVLRTCWQAGRSALDFVSQSLRAFGNPLLPRPVLLLPR